MKLLLSLALCGAMAAAHSPVLRFKADDSAGVSQLATVQFQVATGNLVSSNDIEYNGDTFTSFATRLTSLETAVATVEASIVTMGNTITNHVAIAATDTELATAIANVQLLTTNGTGTSGPSGAGAPCQRHPNSA